MSIHIRFVKRAWGLKNMYVHVRLCILKYICKDAQSHEHISRRHTYNLTLFGIPPLLHSKFLCPSH